MLQSTYAMHPANSQDPHIDLVSVSEEQLLSKAKEFFPAEPITGIDDAITLLTMTGQLIYKVPVH